MLEFYAKRPDQMAREQLQRGGRVAPSLDQDVENFALSTARHL
jgi:hypothetical protein